jgi:uncharacterized protein (DUF952 family)
MVNDLSNRSKARNLMFGTIYKIMTQDQWHQLEVDGTFLGAPIDLKDGYIHFSFEDQLVETAVKHFASQSGLHVVAVDVARLGPALKAEASRGGALFPHLYAPLMREDVLWASPLVWRQDGRPEWQLPLPAQD